MSLQDQRGAAAVELALFMGLLIAVIAIVGPAITAIRHQVNLSRSAGAAVAFASSVPDQRRRACDGTQLGTRSPSAAAVEAEARCAFYGSPTGGSAGFVTVSPDPSAPSTKPGTEIRVTLTETVDLGVLGGSVTLHSTAVGIKE